MLQIKLFSKSGQIQYNCASGSTPYASTQYLPDFSCLYKSAMWKRAESTETKENSLEIKGFALQGLLKLLVKIGFQNTKKASVLLKGFHSTLVHEINLLS